MVALEGQKFSCWNALASRDNTVKGKNECIVVDVHLLGASYMHCMCAAMSKCALVEFFSSAFGDIKKRCLSLETKQIGINRLVIFYCGLHANK